MYEYFKNLCWKFYHDLLSKESAYGHVIQNRTITPSTLGRWRDGAMTKTRWDDSAMAMMQVTDNYGAMVWWRRSYIILHHCYRIISASSLHQSKNFFAHMRYWKTRQDYIVVFNCYDLSITDQTSCMLVWNGYTGHASI